MIEVILLFGVALLIVVTKEILYIFHLDLDYEGYRKDIEQWFEERLDES